MGMRTELYRNRSNQLCDSTTTESPTASERPRKDKADGVEIAMAMGMGMDMDTSMVLERDLL